MTITFEPVNLIISLSTILVVIKFTAKKYVELEFNKKIENHKHELQKIIEVNKFDFQKKLQDFSLYSTKKHEYYQSIYNLFLIADGKARNFLGVRSIPDYLRMNSKQLKYFFEKQDILEVMVGEYLKNWDEDKKEKVQNLEDFMKRYEIDSARLALNDAKNEYLISRLYLSNKVIDICNDLVKAISSNLIDVEYYCDREYPMEDKKMLRDSIEDNNLIINKSLAELREKMIEEIGVGY